MSLRIRFQDTPGQKLGYSIERLSDGLFFDFANSTFDAAPAQMIAPLPEDAGNFAGRYKVTLTPTPIAQFANGDYVVSVHNTAVIPNLVVAQLGATFYNGDDGPVFPTPNLALSINGQFVANVPIAPAT